MRMQNRFAIFIILYIFGSFVVVVGSGFSGTVAFGWFAVFAIGQFVIFRCPHCRKFVFMNNPESHKECPHCRKFVFMNNPESHKECPHCFKSYRRAGGILKLLYWLGRRTERRLRPSQGHLSTGGRSRTGEVCGRRTAR
jgi:hypothetical protein